MMATFAYRAMASVLVDDAGRERLFEGYRSILEEAGGKALAEADPKLPVVHMVLTGGTENQVLEAVAERKERAPKEPVVLVAQPFSNSLPACLEIVARLRRDGIAARVVYLEGTKDAEGAAKVARLAKLAAVCDRMASTRIGAIGRPSDWLVASAQDPEVVAATWGATVVELPIEDLASRLAAKAGVLPDATAQGIFRKARSCREPTEADLAEAHRVYDALREMVAEQGLDALTLRCFDLVTGASTTGCYALSRLSDEGIDSGCEGDVPSILALRWMRLLTGQAAWMANPARIDADRREILLAHCTVPLSIVEGYGLRSHFESGLGAGIAGEFRRGPVTLVRIGGARLERIWTAEGTIVESREEEGLCRTQVRVVLEDASPEDLLVDPLGNHIVMVRGKYERLVMDSHAFLVPPGAKAG